MAVVKFNRSYFIMTFVTSGHEISKRLSEIDMKCLLSKYYCSISKEIGGMFSDLPLHVFL